MSKLRSMTDSQTAGRKPDRHRSIPGEPAEALHSSEKQIPASPQHSPARHSPARGARPVSPHQVQSSSPRPPRYYQLAPPAPSPGARQGSPVGGAQPPAQLRGAPPASPRSVQPRSPRGLGAPPASPRGAPLASSRGAPPASPRGAPPASSRGARPASPRGAHQASPRGAPPDSPGGSQSSPPSSPGSLLGSSRGARSASPRGGRSASPRGVRSPTSPRGDGRPPSPRSVRQALPELSSVPLHVSILSVKGLRGVKLSEQQRLYCASSLVKRGDEHFSSVLSGPAAMEEGSDIATWDPAHEHTFEDYALGDMLFFKVLHGSPSAPGQSLGSGTLSLTHELHREGHIRLHVDAKCALYLKVHVTPAGAGSDKGARKPDSTKSPADVISRNAKIATLRKRIARDKKALSALELARFGAERKLREKKAHAGDESGASEGAAEMPSDEEEKDKEERGIAERIQRLEQEAQEIEARIREDEEEVLRLHREEAKANQNQKPLRTPKASPKAAAAASVAVPKTTSPKGGGQKSKAKGTGKGEKEDASQASSVNVDAVIADTKSSASASLEHEPRKTDVSPQAEPRKSALSPKRASIDPQIGPGKSEASAQSETRKAEARSFGRSVSFSTQVVQGSMAESPAESEEWEMEHYSSKNGTGDGAAEEKVGATDEARGSIGGRRASAEALAAARAAEQEAEAKLKEVQEEL